MSTIEPLKMFAFFIVFKIEGGKYHAFFNDSGDLQTFVGDLSDEAEYQAFEVIRRHCDGCVISPIKFDGDGEYLYPQPAEIVAAYDVMINELFIEKEGAESGK